MNDEAFLETVINFFNKHYSWKFLENSYLFLLKTWMMKLFWKELSISAKNMNPEAFLKRVIYFPKKLQWWSFFFWKQLSIFPKNMNDQSFSENCYLFLQKNMNGEAFPENNYVFLQKTWMMKLFLIPVTFFHKNMNDEAFLKIVIQFHKKHVPWNFSENSYLFPQ